MANSNDQSELVTELDTSGQRRPDNFPTGAIYWTPQQVLADVETAKSEFRRRRFGEPMKKYIDAFERLEKANHKVIGNLGGIFADPVDPALIASILGNKDQRIALRYLAAPPISKDDMDTMVGEKVSATKVKSDPELAASVRDVLKQILDPIRFPWIYEKRDPTEAEVKMAIMSSTVPAASQDVYTGRRKNEMGSLEGAISQLLTSLEFKRIQAAPITVIRKNAPQAGEFMEAALLGEHNADRIIGLFDGRIMALECKASNSQINSRKRINKEVATDARSWVSKFGSDQVVPAAAIQGVYNPNYIISAQKTPVVFYWAHRLEDLTNFILSTKTS